MLEMLLVLSLFLEFEIDRLRFIKTTYPDRSLMIMRFCFCLFYLVFKFCSMDIEEIEGMDGEWLA